MIQNLPIPWLQELRTRLSRYHETSQLRYAPNLLALSQAVLMMAKAAAYSFVFWGFWRRKEKKNERWLQRTNERLLLLLFLIIVPPSPPSPPGKISVARNLIPAGSGQQSWQQGDRAFWNSEPFKNRRKSSATRTLTDRVCCWLTPDDDSSCGAG